VLIHLSRRARHKSQQRGTATIEFALLGMVLVTLMLGASEFGRAMLQYNTLVKAVRSAARYASNYADSATVRTAAQNLVVYGKATAGASGSEAVPGLKVANVSVTYATQDALSNKVAVTVSGLTFQPLASWLLPSFTFGTITAVMTQAK